MLENLQQPSFSATHWIEAVYSSRQVDIAAARDFDPLATLIGSIIEDRSTDEQLASEHAGDPGVRLKNRLLSLLADLATDGCSYIGDTLALMDRQAVGTDLPDETRYRQFMGIFDLAIALSNDPELLEELKYQKKQY